MCNRSRLRYVRHAKRPSGFCVGKEQRTGWLPTSIKIFDTVVKVATVALFTRNSKFKEKSFFSHSSLLVLDLYSNVFIRPNELLLNCWLFYRASAYITTVSGLKDNVPGMIYVFKSHCRDERNSGQAGPHNIFKFCHLSPNKSNFFFNYLCRKVFIEQGTPSLKIIICGSRCFVLCRKWIHNTMCNSSPKGDLWNRRAFRSIKILHSKSVRGKIKCTNRCAVWSLRLVLHAITTSGVRFPVAAPKTMAAWPEFGEL